MKVYLRWFTVFSVLGTAFFGVLVVAADIPQDREESKRTEALRAQEESLFARIDARRQIVEDAIAGKLTLPQAAKKFGALYTYDAETMQSIRLVLSADSDEECLYRQVVLHVKAALEGRTSETDMVLSRLEAELQKYISEHTPET